MRILTLGLALSLGGAARGQTGGDLPRPSPLPPHAAPAPLPPDTPVAVLVDTLPVGARYANYVTLNAPQARIDPAQAGTFGAGIAQTLPQLANYARKQGANLLVLLGAAHGVTVPVRGLPGPLTLAPDRTAVVVLMFRIPGGGGISVPKDPVHFTLDPVPPASALAPSPVNPKVSSLSYAIDLKYITPGMDLGIWVYGNIDRLVTDAARLGFDHVAIASSSDADAAEIALPGCDAPLRVSRAHPALQVSFYCLKS